MHDVTRSSLLVYTAVADIIAATPASCSVKSKTRRSRHRSATAVAASALILSGCVNTVRDLRVSSVAFTNGSQWGLSSAEDRQMLRIDITSQADLPHLAAGTGMILSAHAFFCDHSLDSALLGGFLFATAPGNGHPPARVYQLEEMPVELRNSASLYTYHLILNVALPASPLSRPPESHPGGNLGGAELQPDPLVRLEATADPCPKRPGISLRKQNEEIGVKR